MSYSRRQLEALGEPLGESVTRKEAGRVIYGGGGGSTPATQTQINELPGWAKATAQRNLGKAEALTSDKPYQSFTNWAQQEGIDPNRVAGFNKLQNQAFQGAQDLRSSPALDPAMNMAGYATAGSLGAGQNYMNMATNPGAIQSFMSPYMQNVVDTQQREAMRQSGIQGVQNQAQATQAGAFGGSRQGLLEAERQRNLGTQLGNIQAQGLQSAYDKAQQAQQFGSQLGLQGYGQALQGAGQMANIGTQQFGQQKDILGLQSQFGGQQQANEQAKLGYNMQDYSAAQQYPYQQLSFLSNIIRGTPMGGVSTMYGGQPTMGQTIGSLGMGAYGLSQLAKAKDGGMMESYADGGSVEDPQNIEDIVSKLSDAQLKQAAEAAQKRGDVQQLQAVQAEMAMRASERQGMAGAFNQLPYSQQEQMMAGGGIVAFAGDEDENEDGGLGQLVGGMMPTKGNPEVFNTVTGYFPALLQKVASAKYTPMTEEKYNEAIASRRKLLEEGAGPSPYADIKEKLATMRGDSEKELAQGRGLAALQAAAAMSQGVGLVQGLGRAGGAFAETYGKALQADSAQKRSLMNMELNAADALRKERMGLNRDAITAADQARKDHDAAQVYGLKKATALASVAGKFAQATKPIKGSGSGSGTGSAKEFVVGPAAYEALIREQNPTWSNAKVKSEAFAKYQQQKSAGLPGAELRADVGSDANDIRLAGEITKEQDKVRFLPEYLKATAAEKQLMMDEAAARVRRNANRNSPRVNNNPPQGGSPRLQFDAQGNLLPG